MVGSVVFILSVLLGSLEPGGRDCSDGAWGAAQPVSARWRSSAAASRLHTGQQGRERKYVANETQCF